MIYSLDKLREFIKDKLDDAEIEAQESHKEAPNSYGAGYDRGYAEALKELLPEIPDPSKHE